MNSSALASFAAATISSSRGVRLGHRRCCRESFRGTARSPATRSRSGCASALQLVVADVHAVDLDAARGRIVEARNQTHDRGLAAARRPDDAHHLPRLDGEADTAAAPERRCRSRTRHDRRRSRRFKAAASSASATFRNDDVGVENRPDAFDSHRGLRDRVGHGGQVLDRLEELLR